MKHFIVVDMQNDFCTEALANQAAVKVIPFIKEQLEKARKDGDNVIFTRDTHQPNYMDTLEGKHLPIPHCIEDTRGWNIVDDLAPLDAETIINKPRFGYDHWAKHIKPGDEVTMVGTCTDICVVSNALAIKAIGDIEVTILKDGCAGLSPALHESALAVMQSCQCTIA